MIETDDYDRLSADIISKHSFENLPECPDVSNLLDFLDQTKSIIQRRWVDHMVTNIMAMPESTEKRTLFQIFKNEKGLRSLLEKENFRELEMLRLLGQGPLWREIVSQISQREIVTSLLAKHYVAHLSETDLAKFHFSRQEISLFLDLGLSVQEPIDSAFVHQLKIADSPDGKNIGQHSRHFGYEYLYGETTPFKDVFRDDFLQLVNTLKYFSERIREKAFLGYLPPVYEKLANYLNTLAISFGSNETEAESLVRIWENVDKEYLDLVSAGCPIILNPWGFLVDGNHVGIELMVTLNLAESSRWYTDSQNYLATVKNFMNDQGLDFEPLPFVHQYVFVRNGINIPWTGTACAGDRFVVFYDNENDHFSNHLYQTYYDKFVDGTTSQERFTYVRGLNTVAHETGHLGRMLDQELYQKMGVGVSVGKLDEAKADSMANLLFLRQSFELPSNVAPEEFIEQYIVDYIDELRNAVGHEQENIGLVWYDFSAKIILLTLFECGSILWNGDKVKVVDGARGVETLAELGQQIFNLYGQADFDEKAVGAYVKSVEDKVASNQNLQRLLAKAAAFQQA